MITAKEFYQLFMKALESDEKTVEIYWESSGAKWTNHLEGIIIGILENDFKLKTNKEYFRIDMIGWSGFIKWEDKKEPTYKKHIGYHPYKKSENFEDEYNWNLEVAVEYENHPLKWMDEIIKLCHIKCGLKVVIMYSDINGRSEKTDLEKLNRAAEHISTLEYAKFNANEQFLIIIGNCHAKKPYTTIDSLGFMPYHFVNGKFKKLPL